MNTVNSIVDSTFFAYFMIIGVPVMTAASLVLGWYTSYLLKIQRKVFLGRELTPRERKTYLKVVGDDGE